MSLNKFNNIPNSFRLHFQKTKKSYALPTKEENVAIFRRYISEISCIEGYRHDISYRNIGSVIFQINLEKSAISRDISAILAINQRFFPIYRMVNAGQWKSMCYSAATVRLHLPSGLTYPCYIMCTKLIYT